MTTRKTHLAANKGISRALFAVCASRTTGRGTVVNNSRRTYAFMSSEIVDFAGFKATPAADRCAHCVDIGLQRRNRVRREKGLAPVACLFEGHADALR